MRSKLIRGGVAFTVQTIEAQEPGTNQQSCYKASMVGEIKKTGRKIHSLLSSNVPKTDMQGGEKAKVTHCKLQKQEKEERESPVLDTSTFCETIASTFSIQ